MYIGRHVTNMVLRSKPLAKSAEARVAHLSHQRPISNKRASQAQAGRASRHDSPQGRRRAHWQQAADWLDWAR